MNNANKVFDLFLLGLIIVSILWSRLLISSENLYKNNKRK